MTLPEASVTQKAFSFSSFFLQFLAKKLCEIIFLLLFPENCNFLERFDPQYFSPSSSQAHKLHSLSHEMGYMGIAAYFVDAWENIPTTLRFPGILFILSPPPPPPIS